MEGSERNRSDSIRFCSTGSTVLAIIFLVVLGIWLLSAGPHVQMHASNDNSLKRISGSNGPTSQESEGSTDSPYGQTDGGEADDQVAPPQTNPRKKEVEVNPNSSIAIALYDMRGEKSGSHFAMKHYYRSAESLRHDDIQVYFLHDPMETQHDEVVQDNDEIYLTVPKDGKIEAKQYQWLQYAAKTLPNADLVGYGDTLSLLCIQNLLDQTKKLRNSIKAEKAAKKSKPIYQMLGWPEEKDVDAKMAMDKCTKSAKTPQRPSMDNALTILTKPLLDMIMKTTNKTCTSDQGTPALVAVTETTAGVKVQKINQDQAGISKGEFPRNYNPFDKNELTEDLCPKGNMNTKAFNERDTRIIAQYVLRGFSGGE